MIVDATTADFEKSPCTTARSSTEARPRPATRYSSAEPGEPERVSRVR